jgi:hypothetical protein
MFFCTFAKLFTDIVIEIFHLPQINSIYEHYPDFRQEIHLIYS